MASFIRRVCEDHVESRFLAFQKIEPSRDIFLQYRGMVRQTTERDVPTNQTNRLAASVDKQARTGAPAQGLNAETTGAGEKIKHAGIFHLTHKNIKQGFPHMVGGGANRKASDRVKFSALAGSGDDSQ
jgi:hypothetical protein